MIRHTVACGGQLGRWIDDLNYVPCPCELADEVSTALGSEIAGAPTVLSSPLLTLPKSTNSGDKVDANVFLKGWWHDLLPHLKFAFSVRYIQSGGRFRIRIVTDEKLKSIYLGNESFKNRARSVREDSETYNGLEDYISKEYDLVLVRLGYLGYPNRAMAGILKEALMIREVSRKPTWVIESPSSIFGSGHYSYDADVGDYIDRNFEVISIGGTTTRDIAPHGFAGADAPNGEIEDVGFETMTTAPKNVVQPTARFEAPDYTKGNKKYGNSSKPWKRRGQGPLG